jgi:hypothetical protein
VEVREDRTGGSQEQVRQRWAPGRVNSRAEITAGYSCYGSDLRAGSFRGRRGILEDSPEGLRLFIALTSQTEICDKVDLWPGRLWIDISVVILNVWVAMLLSLAREVPVGRYRHD